MLIIFLILYSTNSTIIHMKNFYVFALCLFCIGQTISAQQNNLQQQQIQETVRNYLINNLNSISSKSLYNNGLTKSDVDNITVTDIVSSKKGKGFNHVYGIQNHNGIPIVSSSIHMFMENGTIVKRADNIDLISDIKSRVTSTKASLPPGTAVNKLATAVGLKPASLNSSSKSPDGDTQYEDTGISDGPIKVTEVYMLNDKGDLRLTYNVTIPEVDGSHWWNGYIDAVTGNLLKPADDWVISCNFGDASHENHNHSHSILETKAVATVANAPAAFMPNSYNVFPLPVESPNHGDRAIVTNPSNTNASPFGWHDTNGSNGAEFTTTRGNNVWAQDDSNGNNGTGFSPDGGSTLEFNNPLNLNQQPSSYRSAAITNLFYWNNVMHDIWYQYGFDEASGNFQENNYGKGGRGSDSVNADAQDGSGTNNANFGTPPDGSNPRMQMFLWTNPTRDGDFDNVVIAHEYGHGISTRLVGGPSRNALGGSEQMGEGWSDWFGLMITMKPGDVGTTGRGVGTYVRGQPTSGRGIRPTQYSTNRSINNTDYADVNTLRRPHGVGYGFATILWDMTWGLIDAEGFDADLYNGTGGNNIAMALVIEGLKNTANNPGYVSGRDGILRADQDLYGGRYECIIWKAFAERGVGQDANENNNGGTNGQTDQTVSFVNPCDGGGPGPGNDECSGNISSFPYAESFEGSIGDWEQASGDDLNWTVDANGTPSNGTGPSSAADGNSYIYVEASTNGTGFPTKRAILNSPCLNFSNLSSPTLSFQYHMLGSAIGTFTVEARTNNDGNWTNVFSRTGAQGNDWNTAEVDLSAYARNSSVQLRLNTVTGDSWQGDVAIDDLRITNTNGGGDACDAFDFNDFTITSFSNQDTSGNFSIVSNGAGLALSNNTWKYIPLDYTVTANTVLEFEFSSTSQGEIHAVGFEDDNTLTATRYFKVHGTQNYGVTNFDNYSGGTTTYTIPVGNFYTGAMDRLVFINDNDTGSGNNSVYSNVRVYEGSCGNSITDDVVASFDGVSAIIGDEDENGKTPILGITISPNPTKDTFVLDIPGTTTKRMTATIYSILGSVKAKVDLVPGINTLSAKNLSLGSGIHLIKITTEGENPITSKIVVE